MNQSSNPVRDELLSRLSVVLARPAFAGNIGASARVMANFGVRQGILVAPRCDINSLEARQYATGSSAVTLATLATVGSLREALVGVTTAVAVTRRTGKMRQPTVTYEAISERLAQGRVCLVFGPEESGLTDDDLTYCSDILTLDVSEQMPSMNLSHAVAVTLAGVFSHCTNPVAAGTERRDRPDVANIHGLTERLRDALIALESRGLVVHSDHLARILSANLRRSRPDASEYDAWQSVISAILKTPPN
jgi:tRNA/rRNA methyltransferase